MICLLEFISLFLSACLCVVCTKSDTTEGIIHNKILLAFAVAAIALDCAYYGLFAADILYDFLPNLLVVAIFSLYLFYSHIFAGGDCKMIIVLALLYPARCYIVYRESVLTLFLAIGFAILAGYIYLLVTSIKAIVTKRVSFTWEYAKSYLLNFLKSYLSAMVYIILINCILILFDRFGFAINPWISRCICMVVAWSVGRYPVFKKLYLLLPAFSISVVFSLITRTMPVSLNPENYALVLILMLCQMTIKTTIYEKVRVEQLQKGMILTTLSSVLMQSSITRGLPGISTEDLKSRLALDEIESIKIWAKATHTEELSVVKKIPFAVFISFGFVCYFVIWGVLS
jgi:hypothetical protein